MVRLFRVILPVGDIERAASFYGGVLETPGRRVSSGRHYFDCGETILAQPVPGQPPASMPPGTRADGDPWDARPNPDHVYFAVDDVEATLERTRAAGCALREDGIRTRPWGERSFCGTDPFGNPVCFEAKTA